MDQDKALRDELVFQLTVGHAHMSFIDAVADFPEEHINTVPENVEYSFWAILEHIRITQKDIVDFIINHNYQELSWPNDYWPEKGKKATREDWQKTIEGYQTDLDRMVAIVKDPSRDLYEKFSWGEGQTIMREALVIVDHTAYHLGEFAILRQVMKTWPKNHA